MRRRDHFRSLLRGSRDPSPLPPSPSPSPGAASTTTIALRGTNAKTSTPSPAALPPSTSVPKSASQNQALQRAIEAHLDTIPQQDKQLFKDAAQSMTDDTVLESIRIHDNDHQQQSTLCSRTESALRILQCLNRFTDAIAIGIQANPDVSSIVVGLARGLISVAIEFTSFYTKLTDMMTRLTDYLDPWTLYANSARNFPILENNLVAVYLDTLTFFRSARRVFVDSQARPRQFTSWRLFWRLQWLPFEDEFGTIERSMHHHRDVLLHTTQALSLGISFEASQDELKRRKREKAREREDFLNWLSSYPYEPVHTQTYNKKHPGTATWLLEHLQFVSWRDASTSTLLWCYGKPGAGKSVLASNVIEHVSSRRALNDQVGIAFIYYDYRAKEMQVESFVLASILKQICRSGENVPDAFLKVKQNAFPPSELGNADAILKAVEHYQMREVFILVDALDECPRAQRRGILKALRHIATTLPCLKLFVTSRPESDIREALVDEMKTPHIAIEAESVQQDIQLYVTEEVCRLRKGTDGQKLHLTDPLLEDTIINTLTTKADGMFLWVNLQLAHLCEESESRNDNDVRQALTDLPAGLNATYKRSMDQITGYSARRREMAFSALRWVVYAIRPVTIEELQAILKFEQGDTGEQVEDSIYERVLLSLCANMLEVSTHWLRIVKPAHYSVQEFITTFSSAQSQGHLLNAEQEIHQIHSFLATKCTAYLLSRTSTSVPCPYSYDIHVFFKVSPFVWYAANSFDFHLEQSQRERTLIAQVRDLLQQNGECLASILQVRSIQPQSGFDSMPDCDTDFHPFKMTVDEITVIFSTKLYGMQEFHDLWESKQLAPSLLHITCSTGLIEAVAYLLDMGADVDAKTENGTRPLYHAALSGNHQIIRLLLTKVADIHAQGGDLGSALGVAACRGDEAIVQLLLKSGADVNLQGGRYGSTLGAASYEGQESIVQLLLNSGADVNLQGGDYGSALGAASFGGYESVVQLLLNSGADVNLQGGDYGSALGAASYEGQESIVQLLLNSGADVNLRGGYYGSALGAASSSYRERESTVQLLLENGADVNLLDQDGLTPLDMAIKRSYDKTATLLRAHGAKESPHKTNPSMNQSTIDENPSQTNDDTIDTSSNTEPPEQQEPPTNTALPEPQPPAQTSSNLSSE